jgi:hypothetical protein
LFCFFISTILMRLIPSSFLQLLSLNSTQRASKSLNCTVGVFWTWEKQAAAYQRFSDYNSATTIIISSGYPWPSDTVKSLGFFKPRETQKGAKHLFIYF